MPASLAHATAFMSFSTSGAFRSFLSYARTVFSNGIGSFFGKLDIPDQSSPFTPMFPDGVEHPASSAWSNAPWTAHDGSVLAIRPMAATDIDIARAFIRKLSFGTRYFRFGRGDLDFSDEELQGVCSADPRTNTHLVVVANDRSDKASIVASARYVVQDDGESCLFGLVVADAWQGHGLGQRLLRALFDSARQRGLKVMQGEVLASNTRMLGFLQKIGFVVEATTERWASVRKVSRILDSGRDS